MHNDSHNKICIHCYVSGRVQGVWYRNGAKVEAEKLGLTGWAKNLDDGRVEVMVCGERKAITKLLQWLKQGPTLAKVTDITTEEMDWQHFEDFSTK